MLSKLLASVLISILTMSASKAAEPLKLDADNPHYLAFRGRSVILMGSSEHYGAVLNAQFDYPRYLDALQAKGLNVTRLFTGAYHDRPGKTKLLPGAGFADFEIVANTLAPEAGSYLAPWARTDVPGAVDGGHKFDLTRWNPPYFLRLKDFVAQASRRGIVVEVSLFSNYYVSGVGEHFWEVSPWNGRNNINGIGQFPGDEALTLKHGRLLAVQDALVRKLVEELHSFDNVYYEICNEPDTNRPDTVAPSSWHTGASLDWQQHIAKTIQAAEAAYPLKHLIAQEVGYGEQKAVGRLTQTSLLAFHNSEGEAVPLNYGLNIPIVHNETIFHYTDTANRVAAWRFLLSGGAMYLGVDYSFTVGHEDGSFVVPPGGAGGGSPVLRRQLQVLHRFVSALPFTRMTPQPTLVRAGVPQGAHVYALGQPGETYAMYFYHGHSEPFSGQGILVDETPQQLALTLALPEGRYIAKWIDPKTGAVMKTNRVVGGPQAILETSPQYSRDIAVLLLRTRP